MLSFHSLPEYLDPHYGENHTLLGLLISILNGVLYMQLTSEQCECLVKLLERFDIQVLHTVAPYCILRHERGLAF